MPRTKKKSFKTNTTAGKTSEQAIPDLQGALRSLEAKEDVLTSQAPTGTLGEAVSEKVMSEFERTSGEWETGRGASEVERAMQTRSNTSPASPNDHTRMVQEERSRLDAKTTLSIKGLSAPSTEILDLKNWIGDALAASRACPPEPSADSSSSSSLFGLQVFS